MTHGNGFFLLRNSRSAVLPEIHSGPYDGIKTFLINLDHSKERLNYTLPQLNKLNFPVERISAIHGGKIQNPEQSIDNYIHKQFFAKSMGPGTLGCSLSHIKAWQAFLTSKYKFALVCEDDIFFDPAALSLVIDNLVSDDHLWDICGLQLNHRGAPLTVKHYGDHRLVIYLFPVSGAGCYLINRRAATQLLLKSLPVKLPVDHFYARSWEFQLCFTGIEPRVVQQNYGDSEISTISREKRISLSLSEKIVRCVWVIEKSIINFFYNLALYANKRWRIRLMKF